MKWHNNNIIRYETPPNMCILVCIYIYIYPLLIQLALGGILFSQSGWIYSICIKMNLHREIILFNKLNPIFRSDHDLSSYSDFTTINILKPQKKTHEHRIKSVQAKKITWTSLKSVFITHYPPVNWHDYGNVPFVMGKSTINVNVQ